LQRMRHEMPYVAVFTTLTAPWDRSNLLVKWGGDTLRRSCERGK
jgi:hypothetical protein